MQNCTVSRARLDQGVQRAHQRGPHLVPLWEAVRDYGVGLAVVPQGKEPFAIPEGGARPAIMLIGDDLKASLGPAGFDRRSLKSFIKTCVAGVIVSCEPIWDAYASAACTCVREQKNVILVETRLENEVAWHALLRKTNPSIRLLIATVKPQGAA